jgi:hypothetical protein
MSLPPIGTCTISRPSGHSLVDLKKATQLRPSIMQCFWSGILKLIGSSKTHGELGMEMVGTFTFLERQALTVVLGSIYTPWLDFRIPFSYFYF